MHFRPSRRSLLAPVVAALLTSSAGNRAWASSNLAIALIANVTKGPKKSGKKPSAFDTAMAEAEQAREADDRTTSASAYSAAFRALPDKGQYALIGEVTVDNALADFRLALERQPDSTELLETAIALLEEFVQVREQAHQAKKAEPVPQPMRDQLEQWRIQLAQAQAPPVDASPPSEKPEPVESMPPPPARRHPTGHERTIDAVILGTGLTVLIGGVTQISVGGWNFVRVSNQGETRLAALASLAYPENVQQDYRSQLSNWQQRWRGTATGLTIAGSVLAATGIGLTIWGAVRLRRSAATSGRWAHTFTPTITKHRALMTLHVNF